MRPTGVLALLGLGVAIPMTLRIIEFGGSPPFAVGFPETSPLEIRLEGLSTLLRCGPGHLDLRAGTAVEGHEDVAHFRFGPSTFVDLREAVATYQPNEGSGWIVRSRRARWTGDEIRFEGHPIVRDGGGRTTVVRRAVVRLGTGDLVVE